MENKKRSISTKTFAILLAVVLIIGCMAGGTIAWLIDSKTVTNTFTYGDINITLLEHKYDPATNELTNETTTEVNNYTIIPGINLPKDPEVTVAADSEDCYLFVKVKEEGTFVQGKVTYSVDRDNWTELTGVAGTDKVYYRVVNKADATKTFNILTNDEITVSNTLEKNDIKNLGTPKLTFTAYAVQKAGNGTAAEAWAKVNA